jgi:ELWxxDGT repeat protein
MQKYLLKIVCLLLIISFNEKISAQISLVKDINDNPGSIREPSDYGNIFCECGDYLFFIADTEKGREVWRTDGTSEGTILIKDINPGFGDMVESLLLCNANNQVFFSGNDGLHGSEIWITDGNANGTRLVKDVTPGIKGANTLLGVVGNTLYFFSDSNQDDQWEIWKSDGAEDNTLLVSNVPMVGYPNVFQTVASDTHVFMYISSGDNTFRALWAIEAASGNSQKILDANWIHSIQRIGTKVLFVSGDESGASNKLWLSDGTEMGTVMVKDFGWQVPHGFHKFQDRLLFNNSGEIWISDGTEDGTTFLTSGYMDAAVAVGNNFFGFGFDFQQDSYRFFKTDGTSIDNKYVDVNNGDIRMYSDIAVLGNDLIMQYYDSNVGKEVGRIDMALGNFELLKDIKPGEGNSEPKSWISWKDKIYFLADDGSNGSEIWTCDGTTGGTVLLKNAFAGTGNAFSLGSSGRNLATSQGILQLLASPSGPNVYLDKKLFTSDGTEQGTVVKFDFASFGWRIFVGNIGDDLIYFHSNKFYKTNGLTTDVTLIKDNTAFTSGYRFMPNSYRLDDKLFFQYEIFGSGQAGFEFWVTDGTEEGTHVLKDINPGVASGSSGKGIILGSNFIFDAKDVDNGSELWISDGTTEGTLLLKDINEGPSDSSPNAFALLQGNVVFTCDENSTGSELWITDGTMSGTILLKDIIPGTEGSNPTNLTSIGNVVLFTLYNEQTGWSLWRTDGTELGTQWVKEINSSGSKSYNFPTNFKSINRKVFFSADNGESGMELWVSDGTSRGTIMIDIVEGSLGSSPSLFTDVNGVVYFQANLSLFRTNGTAMGTSKISDLEPLEIIHIDNWIYFTAPHPDYGTELFKTEFKKLDQQIVFEPIEEKTFGGQPFLIEASASSGLPVTITNGEELKISNTTATIIKPGKTEVSIRQPGDALYNEVSVTQTFCILPPKPTVSATGLSAPILLSSSDEGNQWYESTQPIDGANDKSFEPPLSGTYKVNVTIEGCVSEFSLEETIIITGIESVDDQISFYPNPAHEKVSIKALQGSGTLQIDIFDLHGQRLGTYTLESNEVTDHAVVNYPNGLYLIKIVTGKKVSYSKLIKE